MKVSLNWKRVLEVVEAVKGEMLSSLTLSLLLLTFRIEDGVLRLFDGNVTFSYSKMALARPEQ
ncbi:MAG: hypothetical protein JNN07_29080 [Verrucomicrobiales bacterium]|nr:hypothetical protein [Verrucomicrobiales bacterium]